MLIPIGHESRVQHFPYVTVGLIILNLVIFIPSWYSELSYQKRMEEVAEKIQAIDPFYFDKEQAANNPEYSQVRDLVTQMRGGISEEQKRLLDEFVNELNGLDENQPFKKWGSIPKKWSLITSVTSAFLHGGWLHLIGNMLFLWMVGCNIEDRWGPWFFSVFYILGAIISSGADALSRLDSMGPAIGASGAVGAVMGAFLSRYARTKIRFFYVFFLGLYLARGTFTAPAFVMLPLWLLVELFYGMSGIETGIAHWAHIGGFVFGAAAGLTLWLTGVEKKYFVPRYSLEGEEHEVPESYKRAHELLAKGDRDGAKRKFIQSIMSENGYLPAFLSLSKIYAEDNNREDLIKVTEEITKRTLAKEPHIAIEVFQRLLKAFPDASLSPINQFRMASTLASGGFYQEASWAYHNLTANYPNEVLAQKSILASADLLTDKMGLHENAIEMYNYFITYFPNSPLAEQARRGLKKAQAASGIPIS